MPWMPAPIRIALPSLVAMLSTCPCAWAQNEPPPPAEPIVIHVSSSTGVDGQDGRSPETAVKSIRRGQALLRNGEADRLLLKRGDTFEEIFGNWNKSGATPDEPLVIGAYGEGPRPKVVARDTIFNIYGNQPLLHDVLITGLHFVAAGRNPDGVDYDPAAPGTNAIRIIRPVHRMTIDDCRFEFYSGNLILTGDANRRLQEITVRRCVVVDSYSTAGPFSGQGLYADKVDGLTIDQCVFDHNGWNEKVPGAVANIYRHNIYISSDTTDVRVTGNVIARGASHGVQLRSGGVCEGNLFVENAINAFMAGEDAVFRGNVIVGGRDIDEKNPRGMGIMMSAGKGLIEDNLIIHKHSSTATGGAINVEVRKWTPPTGVHVEIKNNIVYDWAGNGLEVTQPVKSLTFSNNDLQRILGRNRKVITIKKPVDVAVFSGNRYDAHDPPRDKWFSTIEGFVSPQEWMTKTRDDSRLEQASYPDAARTLPPDFVARARAGDKDRTAAAAIAPLREAFGKKIPPAPDVAARTP